jgi:hypothetical protein
MAHFKNPLMWFRGVVAAFITGASATIADVGADLILDGSVTLNIQKLGMKALVMGAIGAAMYLKQSPLPVIEETTFTTKQ